MTIIDTKAFIFGGQRSSGELCSTDVHAISLNDNPSESQYACYPAFPLRDTLTGDQYAPTPRKQHAACARGRFLVIHGGCDGIGSPIQETCLWLWDSEHLSWSKVEVVNQIGTTLAPRFGHSIFLDEKQDTLILHGGRTGKDEEASKETWLFTFDSSAWTELPTAPVSPAAAAFAGDTLYTLCSDSKMGGTIHLLDIRANATDREKPDSLVWRSADFPTNPLTPGPTPREGGALVPVTTGYGRWYLIYMFGESESSSESGRSLLSDIWSLQLPTHPVDPAGAKDAIRKKLPHTDSGEFSWAEVELAPTEQLELEGKAHPGPRAFFGADTVAGKVVLWGGINAKGNAEGDGWVLQIL